MFKAIKKLNNILRPADKRKVLVIFFLMLFAAVLEVVGLGLILMFVSIVSDPEKILSIQWLTPLLSFFGIINSKDLLIYGSVALISLFVFKNTFLLAFNFIQSRFVYNRFKYITNSLFERYMHAPYTYHLNKNTALLVRNIVTDTILLTTQIMLPILQIIMESIIVLSIIIFLFISEPLVSLVVLVLIGGAGGLLLKILKKRLKTHGVRAVEHRGQMIKKVNEGLGGVKEITVLNRQFWFIKEFKESVNNFTRAQVFNQVAGKSSKPIIETVAVAGMLSIALVLIWQGRGVEAVIPVLTLFAAASFKLLPSIDKITNNYNTMRYHSHILDNIHRDFMDLDKKILKQVENKSANPSKVHLKEKLKITGVRYQYPESSRDVLRDLTFSITKGEVVGFAGPSGVGKTTIADLILGLIEPTQGTIKVDGLDIRKNLAGWQKNIGYIPQFIFLLDSTIRDNIAFGLDKNEINERRILDVVKIAQLEELINESPRGLDTIIGERGVRLSGGQRQRIGIARALYDSPEVLVMDEATSSLDNRAEKGIMDAVENLKRDRTIIIIAHRLTTMKNCDRIFLIKNGSISGSGSYDELLEKNNEFKSMVYSM